MSCACDVVDHFQGVIWAFRQSPKKSLEKGSRAQKVRKESKIGLKTGEKLDFFVRLLSDFLGPWGREASGTPFKTFFRTSGRKAQMTPVNGQRHLKAVP